MVQDSFVPPDYLPRGPSVSPHHPLVIRLSQLPEFPHKVVHVRGSSGGRGLYKRRRERLGRVVLVRRHMAEAEEQKLRAKTLHSRQRNAERGRAAMGTW